MEPARNGHSAADVVLRDGSDVPNRQMHEAARARRREMATGSHISLICNTHIVCPGGFWNRGLTPASLHGVTTGLAVTKLRLPCPGSTNPAPTNVVPHASPSVGLVIHGRTPDDGPCRLKTGKAIANLSPGNLKHSPNLSLRLSLAGHSTHFRRLVHGENWHAAGDHGTGSSIVGITRRNCPPAPLVLLLLTTRPILTSMANRSLSVCRS